ncbi:MAG: TonB-dependent receptor [Pseudomonadota bacterium]|nr:TonB-dependent receptor [Pseudomonadota bacterium]
MRISKRVLTICLASASLFAASAAQAQDDSASNIGEVSVTGAGTALGSGNMVLETASKGRSTVTNAGINNLLPTSNPFQDMNLLPGVAQENLDATGLFGGQITIRGMRADEMGFTINGAPVNDSGNYAIYPQEYADTENLDQIFVTQGSTDVDSPHVGATGGNIGIVTRGPSDKFNVMLEETAGDDNLQREFVRFDSGYVGPVKVFLSYSHARADKWRGDGGAKRDHFDGEIFYKIHNSSSVSLNVLYNDSVANFFRQLSLSDFQTHGRNYDYSTTLDGNPSDDKNFWALQVNPFKNAVVNFKVNLQLTDNLRFDFEPYYWYGWGGGGFGQSVKEGSTTGNGGYTFPSDINGNGVTGENVLLYKSSVTRTKRPGFNTRLTYDMDNWTFQLGGWYEKANHRQTQPYSYVNANGTACDVWLTSTPGNRCVVLATSGVPAQGRDQLTSSEGSSIFGNVTGRFLNDALKANLGLSYRTLDRSGEAYLPIPIVQAGGYPAHPHFNYHELLPSGSVSYDVTDEHQLFADFARNFKAPANYVMFTYNSAGTVYLNQSGQAFKPETSWVYEAGYRYHGTLVNGSLTGFYNDVSDYQATAQVDPNDPVTFTSVNIGGVRIRGVEAEAGTAPWHGLTLYGSATYQDSELTSNFSPKCIPACGTVGAVAQHLPTKGKQLPDTPHVLAAASVGYENSGFFANISPKYTGERQSTLMNDEHIPGYWTVDLTAGYTFKEAIGALHDARLQFFVTNLFDKSYLGEINSTGYANRYSQNSIEGHSISGSTVYYSPGAPRFFGVRLSADFQ